MTNTLQRINAVYAEPGADVRVVRKNDAKFKELVQSIKTTGWNDVRLYFIYMIFFQLNSQQTLSAVSVKELPQPGLPPLADQEWFKVMVASQAPADAIAAHPEFKLEQRY